MIGRWMCVRVYVLYICQCRFWRTELHVTYAVSFVSFNSCPTIAWLRIRPNATFVSLKFHFKCTTMYQCVVMTFVWLAYVNTENRGSCVGARAKEKKYILKITQRHTNTQPSTNNKDCQCWITVKLQKLLKLTLCWINSYSFCCSIKFSLSKLSRLQRVYINRTLVNRKCVHLFGNLVNRTSS